MKKVVWITRTNGETTAAAVEALGHEALLAPLLEVQPIDADLSALTYDAVIFTSHRKLQEDGYASTAQRMVDLAAKQPGFLGHESIRDSSGLGITVSYWDSLENIQKWRQHSEHQFAQEQGKTKFYSQYKIRIAQVVRDY